MELIDENINKIKEIIKNAQNERRSFISEVKELGFKEIGNLEKPNTVISQFAYSKNYGNKTVLLIQQHTDRCKTFVIRPDGISVKLIIKEGENDISKEEFGWREKPTVWESDD